MLTCKHASMVALHLALAGCAGAAPWWGGKEPPAASIEEEAAIAGDLMRVLVEEWPPAWTAARTADAAWEERLRTAGYAIGKGGAEVRASVSRLGDLDTLRASVEVGREWRADRLYGRDAAGRLSPRTGWTIRGQRGDAETLPAGAYSRVVPDMEPPPEAVPPTGEDAVAVPAAAAPAAGPCRRVEVRRGSLLANVGRLLRGCGYRVGHWPGAGAHVHDAVIEDGYQLEVDGLRGVLDHVRGYGFAGRASERTRVVDFERLSE